MIAGLSLALLVGAALGLLGGGGSILTVPIFVYVLGIDPKAAIAMSLGVVAVVSLFGVRSHWREGRVDLRIALAFGPVAMLGTYAGARLSVFVSGATQLALFAGVMLLAAVFMFRDRPEQAPSEGAGSLGRWLLIAVEGLAVGVLTGLVGVGGGFLIVPTLVLLAGVPMKTAVGTSLLVIAMKSVAGFVGYLGTPGIDLAFMGWFSAAAVLGIVLGSRAVGSIPQRTLRRTFAGFLVVMGIFILYQSLS
ncbi:sulfite exporter TauE/SafE family protein [Gemmatimonadota bacterium Y43]|uniref:sulfite exporter TauE/SafE family protein n=1 Tax=Gaopeijia maritima TaxID=3119007 RepID=UPI003289A6A5